MSSSPEPGADDAAASQPTSLHLKLVRAQTAWCAPLSLATPRKRPNLVGPQEIVKVNVHARAEGAIYSSAAHQQTFSIHKDHICHYSPFFDAAFNGKFVESRNQEVQLYEVGPVIFGMFVNWLYTQEIVSADGEVPATASLVHLWLLADRLLVPSLQNQAIDLIERTRQLKGDRLPSDLFPVVYENTTPESALRLYVVRICSALYLAQIKNTKNYPVQLLIDIINSIRMRATGLNRLGPVTMAPYHVKEEDGEADRAKRQRTQ